MSVLSCRICLQELGLLAGTPVGTSMIDAHAGGVGVMESKAGSDPESKGSCYLWIKNGIGYSDLTSIYFSLLVTHFCACRD